MKIFIKYLLVIIGMLSFTACQRMRIEVGNIPLNTPEGAAIYATGNFNNWNPADPDYKLQLDPQRQVWFTEIPLGFGKVNYKFTRGDWTSVEVDSCGSDILDRNLLYDANLSPMHWISGWKDLAPIYCNRLTIVLDTIPYNTPAESNIYLSGNINYWMLGQPEYKFNLGPDNKYYLTVPRIEEKLVFKLNRGTWESIEADANNGEIESREIEFGDKDTVHIAMRHWIDLPYKESIYKTIIVKNLPPMKPSQKIYLSGSFNNWHPKDETRTFKKNAKGQYFVNVTLSQTEAVYYKITLGGWEQRELKANGSEMNNRVLLKTDPDTVYIEISRCAQKTQSAQNLPGMTANSPKSLDNIALPPIPIKPENAGKTPLRKVVFMIDKMPELRNKEEGIYLAGDFNNWQTDLPAFEFKTLKNGKRYYVLNLFDTKDHYYKITRGDWTKEEADAYRNKMGNKRIAANKTNDTIHLNILNWVDYYPAKKLTVQLTEVPANTPLGSNIYLTGDFNGWQPNGEAYRFKNVNGKWLLHIPYFTEEYGYFKITRGDWSKEFSHKNGRVLPDQAFRRYIINDTLKYKVEGWKDLKN